MYALWDHQLDSGNPHMSAYAIAKYLGMKPSSHVKKMLDEVLETGWISYTEMIDLFGKRRCYYYLPPHIFEMIYNLNMSMSGRLNVMKRWFEE
jgi:hypothetical protein